MYAENFTIANCVFEHHDTPNSNFLNLNYNAMWPFWSACPQGDDGNKLKRHRANMSIENIQHVTPSLEGKFNSQGGSSIMYIMENSKSSPLNHHCHTITT